MYIFMFEHQIFLQDWSAFCFQGDDADNFNFLAGKGKEDKVEELQTSYISSLKMTFNQIRESLLPPMYQNFIPRK